MKPSDILKFCTGKWGGRYAFENCNRRDCCPGEPGHHVYVPDASRVGGMRSVVTRDHPRCPIVARRHRHIRRLA